VNRQPGRLVLRKREPMELNKQRLQASGRRGLVPGKRLEQRQERMPGEAQLVAREKGMVDDEVWECACIYPWGRSGQPRDM